MKRIVPMLFLLCVSAAFLAGCNTIAGAGKDVQKAGEVVEEAAKS